MIQLVFPAQLRTPYRDRIVKTFALASVTYTPDEIACLFQCFCIVFWARAWLICGCEKKVCFIKIIFKQHFKTFFPQLERQLYESISVYKIEKQNKSNKKELSKTLNKLKRSNENSKRHLNNIIRLYKKELEKK